MSEMIHGIRFHEVDYDKYDISISIHFEVEESHYIYRATLLGHPSYFDTVKTAWLEDKSNSTDPKDKKDPEDAKTALLKIFPNEFWNYDIFFAVAWAFYAGYETYKRECKRAEQKFWRRR